MKSSMDEETKKRMVSDFTKIVDEILCYVWDPISVSVENLPFTRKEYRSYVSDVCSKVMAGATEDEVSQHLRKIEIEYMGMKIGPEKRDKATELIFKCYKVLMDDPKWAHNMISYFD